MTLSEHFSKELVKTKAVFNAKLIDYGASFLYFSPLSLTDQLYIKILKVQNLFKNKKQYVEGEENSLYSECIGIFNYAIISLMKQPCISSYNNLSTEDIKEFNIAYNNAVDECYNLLVAKNFDYGNTWNELKLCTYIDMMRVKIERIRQLESDFKNADKIRDNLIDIVNYAMFTLIRINP